jgi:hypothetical protein
VVYESVLKVIKGWRIFLKVTNFVEFHQSFRKAQRAEEGGVKSARLNDGRTAQ